MLSVNEERTKCQPVSDQRQWCIERLNQPTKREGRVADQSTWSFSHRHTAIWCLVELYACVCVRVHVHVCALHVVPPAHLLSRRFNLADMWPGPLAMCSRARILLACEISVST